MFNKRGVDAVVATVLIIMITVSAVAIIWATVIPMIKNSASTATAEKVSLTIETAGGYTVSEYFNGSIDNVMVWNRTLTATEISQLYTNTLH